MSRHQPWSEEDLEAAKQRMMVRGGVIARHNNKTERSADRSNTTSAGVTAGAIPAPSPTIQSFFVPGMMPGQNIILGRATRWLYRKEKKLWEAKALLAILDARLHPMKRVHITLGWVERNKRRDPDNFTGLSKKFLLDAMVKSGILPDDGWDEIAGWSDRWHLEKDNPGVMVTLEERA